MLTSSVDQIKNRLDIIEIISSYIRLKKAGRNYKALCPFHKEKTPSFMVSPERQIWHCFGCGTGGSIFDFVMQIEGVEFADALRTLAQRAGVVLKRQDPKIQSQRKQLYEICELAAKFFIKQLWASTAGKKALDYLQKRGLKKQTIKEWRVGWAPNTWHGLENFLKSKRYKDEEILRAGLTVEKEKDEGYPASPSQGGPARAGGHDRFRSRIIFPISDIAGQIIGFGGRIFLDSTTLSAQAGLAKYINTPQGLIYDKSRVVYGLAQAKLSIKREKKVIVTEGYTDVLMSHQSNIKEVVASSGTALTESQLRILKRYTDNLLLAFDMDIAGDTATKRAIELAQEIGFNIKVVVLPKKDPADLIKENPKKWQKAIEQAVPIMDFYFQNALAKFDCQKVEGKKEIGKVLLPIIAKLPNKIEQGHWLQELSRRLRIGESVLLEQMKKTKSGPRVSYIAKDNLKKPVSAPKTRLEQIEQRAAAILFNWPQYFKTIRKKDLDLFSNEDLKKIILECSEKSRQKKLLKSIGKKYNHLFFLLEQDPFDEKDALAEINTCLDQLRCAKIKQQLTEITFEIKEAEKQNDEKRLSKLLKQYQNLAKKLSINE